LKVFEGITRVLDERIQGWQEGTIQGGIYKSMKQIKNTKPNDFQKRVLIQLLV
jgi:hypothetical protein